MAPAKRGKKPTPAWPPGLPMPWWAPGFDERRRQIFKAWLNEKLEESYDQDVSADDIAREEWIAQHRDEYEAAFHQFHRRQRKRAMVARLVRDKDSNAIERLTANDPELAQEALRMALYQHPRGRAKGDRRPRDLSFEDRVILGDALNEYERIRDIIQSHYGRFNGAAEIALEVAAERSRITKKELRRFQRHQPPRRYSARLNPPSKPTR